MMTLWEVATEISRRLSRMFLRDEHGKRPVYNQAGIDTFDTNPYYEGSDSIYEYFHDDTCASH